MNTNRGWFWKYVPLNRDFRQCWEWLGTLTRVNGYGKLRWDGRWELAHRISYTIYYGPIPEDAYICHHCDNPKCVNPNHLYVGSALTNNHDTLNRGRRPSSYQKSERQRLKEAANLNVGRENTSEVENELF